MSLAQALATAVAGLRTTQAGMAIVAGNVANAQTPGYVRKSLILTPSGTGDYGVSVDTNGINRELDQYVQSQLRTETSGGAYADLRSQLYQQLQQIYGNPGSNAALETTFNNFTGAVQALTTSPEDYSAQSAVLSSAQALTEQLNQMTTQVQGMRESAEQGLAQSVQQANNDLQQIAKLNAQLSGSTTDDAAAATLKDQRDTYIDQLSQLMDIKVVAGDHNQVTVFTNSGVQLVGTQAAQLSFNAQGTMTASSQWNADPTKSGVGTITLVAPNGGSVDLIANKAIRSGQIAAYLNMRDNVLVQAQNQLDGLAAAMSQALSDQTTPGTAVTVGAQTGFNVDTSGLSDGNSINLTYTDTGGQQHQVTIVRVDDPSVLPLADTVTANPNDQVIGVDFSGGMASVVSQLNTALGSDVQFSNPSGSTLEMLNASSSSSVDAASTTATATGLAGGSAELPFFTDGASPYTGAITASGSESVGLAGRITVNSALLADPSALIDYSGSTPAGDTTRPNFIYNQLTTASQAYSPDTGIGSTNSPYSGPLSSYLQQVLSQQGNAAQNASNLAQGQDIVVNALQQRLSDNSGVNVDQEMSNLITLQNSYAANARVLSAVQKMLQQLLNI